MGLIDALNTPATEWCMSASDTRVRQLGAHIGAEVSGMDLRALDPGAVATIKSALARHAVLIFPDQDLTPDDLLALAAHFGEVEHERFIPKLEGHPGVHV